MRDISVQEALTIPGAKLIDVRSQGEFGEATIPGAVNMPVLSDTERAAVGTAYRHQGVEDARSIGLEFVSPRLPQMVKQYEELGRNHPLVVFCWRGGMRSKSVCSLLDSVGVPVFRLVGGYKAYRRYVNEYLSGPLPHQAVVLHGLTGVGKTEVLEELRLLGAPAVDLEGLASNRGSVFGQIGMDPQPSQKMFDGLLVRELAFWEKTGFIIVECESRRIGRIILPESLTEAMVKGTRILLYCPLEFRMERIKRIYSEDSETNREMLISAIRSLEQRIGKNRAAKFIEQVKTGDLDEVVRYLLIQYYDPLYKYPSQASSDYELSVDTTFPDQAAQIIKNYLEKELPIL